MVKANETTIKSTDITMILDRSGSMGRIHEQVIRSFNDFLAEQKAVEGEAKISMIQFDNQYEVNYEGVDIQKAEDLNTQTYEPRGMTALNDAIGRTITNMKVRLKDTIDNVVVVITTDGMENASVEYRRSQIREMIKECEEKLGWKFMYLAADDASFDEYEGMGMERGRSFKSGRGRRGYDNAAKLMSAKIAGYRSHEMDEYLDFTEKERQEAEDLGDE
ncbi:MAG: VWA domain-containing protein [Planctomycetes bacterium]|nr:VWA domain-containing protein [Planctomycetota bacterium]